MMGNPSKCSDFYLGIQTFSGGFVLRGENHNLLYPYYVRRPPSVILSEKYYLGIRD